MATLGHVVFYVRDLGMSVKFYTEVVGLGLSGRIFNDRAALLSGGSTHHDLRDPDGNEVELYVDDPDYDWRSNDSWMEAPVKPLKLGE